MTSPNKDQFKDSLVRFMLGVSKGAKVRGEVVKLGTQWQEIAKRHPSAAPLVLTQLAELSAAGLLLASMLKFDGTLSLQIQGDGPLALLIVEVETDQTFRATYKVREGQEAGVAAAKTLHELVNVSGSGRFALTLAPHSSDMAPYQGMISLNEPSIAKAIEDYMRRSEQVPTSLQLLGGEQGAAGLLLQRIAQDGGKQRAPDEELPPDEDWNTAVVLAESLSSAELADLPASDIIHRLFWEQDLGNIDARHCRFRCRCSLDKVRGMLQMLGQTEVDSIIAERGEVEVNCEFCNTRYAFDAVDAKALFVAAEASHAAPSGGRVQ